MENAAPMRHPKAIKPKQGQESVWDYPRPPKLEPVGETVRVIFNEKVLAQSTEALRILETSHPPTIYIPKKDIDLSMLEEASRNTYCEWKGRGSYYHLLNGDRVVQNAAWYYHNPRNAYKDLKNHIAFYPSKVDQCFIGDEEVEAQAGDFYGGWITSKIVGPYKGGDGTFGW
jgi:uncharacterized protein (DUF427 family)